MNKRSDILVAAELCFERDGFHAVPIDRIIHEAVVSPRTLYTHFESKTDLAGSVLSQRAQRFIEELGRAREARKPLEDLFDRLENWLEKTPATGCLFLRALGEFQDQEIVEIVRAYKRSLHELCLELCGGKATKASSLVLLIEGSTALAPVAGASQAIRLARNLAKSGGLM